MIKIMADSTCDLSEEVIAKYDIDVVPLTVVIDGENYRDRIDIQPDEIYEKLPTMSELPTTAMPSPSAYINVFEAGIDKGYNEFLCICMSSGTSGSYQSAVLAKELFYENNPDSEIKIHIVDSQCMSHGSGWLILKSAKLKELGAGFEDLVLFNETVKTCVRHFLSVDDLNNLIKSGRLSSGAALIGKVLNVKPVMSMKDGKGAVVAKFRGQKKVLNHYVEEFKKCVHKGLTDFTIIGYTSNKKVAEKLKEKLVNETFFDGEIHIMQMGAAVGTHVGLGGLSFYFVQKREEFMEKIEQLKWK